MSLQPSPIPKAPIISTCAEPHTITTSATSFFDLVKVNYIIIDLPHKISKHNDCSQSSSPEPSRNFIAEFLPDPSVPVQLSTDAQTAVLPSPRHRPPTFWPLYTSTKNALASARDARRRMEGWPLLMIGSHPEGIYMTWCMYFFTGILYHYHPPPPSTLTSFHLEYVDLTDNLPAPKKRRELHKLSGKSPESNQIIGTQFVGSYVVKFKN